MCVSAEFEYCRDPASLAIATDSGKFLKEIK